MAEQTAPTPYYEVKSYEQLFLTEAERTFYRELAENGARRRLVSELVVAPRTGASFAVAKGQLVRIECHEDAQVADLNVFNRDNPREHFSSSQSRVIHGSHLTTGHRLWSHPIYQRPMMTIVADSVDHSRSPEGARSNDLLFGMCDEPLYFRRTGRHGMPSCRGNLTKAAAELGLPPEAVHDPLNIFMMTGLNQEGRVFYLPPRAKRGDYIEMHAEMDCLCAISACPGASSGPRPGGLKITTFAVAD